MKNIFLFVAMLLLTTPVIAQELTGKWLINFQITEKEISEYIIYKPNKERAFGNYILINENETFSTYEAQECGSYCNIKTLGTYKMIDENYIQFILKSVLKNRFCQDKDYNPNKNIGLYYIHREEDKIRLLKSDGSIEKDRQNVIYSKMIEDFFNFQRMFPSGNKISSAKIEKMSEKDMVNTYLTN